MEPPVVSANYTYLGDTDILLTESVLTPMRLQQMEHFGIPYSNIIRPNTKRLTGVMLLKTDEFYTPTLLEKQGKSQGTTGATMYHLVKSSDLGLPKTVNKSDNWTTYRPIHELHLSTNRGPGKRMCHDHLMREPLCQMMDGADYLCHDNATGLDLMLGFVNDISAQTNMTPIMTDKSGICL
jgi:hypothetical protein